MNVRRFFLIGLGLFGLIRVYLVSQVLIFGTKSLLGVFASLILGAIYDAVIISYALIPLVLIKSIVPERFLANKLSLWAQRSYAFFVLFVFLFSAFGEPFFWDEFKSRYNFIAVDYLIYTTEVINNIWESYPLGWFLAVVSLLSGLGAYWTTTKTSNKYPRRELAFISILIFGNLFIFNQSLADSSESREVNELSKNGLYSFISAYFHNEINYTDFYETRPIEKTLTRLQSLVPKSRADTRHGLFRTTTTTAVEHRYNVIIVVMESLSAKFMKRYGSTQNITPILDGLTNESLYFSNILATGTRTVRGLEALTLGVPPTPGQSIVRRPQNKNLYNIGTIFRSKGYKTQFIYGGHSYFDNMRDYFSSNGYEIIDQGNFVDSEITFANAWGVCDEDIFKRTSREADKHYQNKIPFFQMVLTTSNHRPYTYPQNIDIPSGEGRHGAVKYADFAIGKFLDDAKTRPWYKNTLFVFVSDHNAGLSGKSQVPVDDYTIPMIFYNPNIVPTKIIPSLASQIDLIPTLFGILNFNYENRFFGQDLLKDTPNRALVSNFQYVGLLKDKKLVILGPKQKIEKFNVPSFTEVTPATDAEDVVEDTIAYYQSASYFFQNKLLLEIPTTADKPESRFKSPATHPKVFADIEAKYSKSGEKR